MWRVQPTTGRRVWSGPAPRAGVEVVLPARGPWKTRKEPPEGRRRPQSVGFVGLNILKMSVLPAVLRLDDSKHYCAEQHGKRCRRLLRLRRKRPLHVFFLYGYRHYYRYGLRRKDKPATFVFTCGLYTVRP